MSCARFCFPVKVRIFERHTFTRCSTSRHVSSRSWANPTGSESGGAGFRSNEPVHSYLSISRTPGLEESLPSTSRPPINNIAFWRSSNLGAGCVPFKKLRVSWSSCSRLSKKTYGGSGATWRGFKKTLKSLDLEIRFGFSRKLRFPKAKLFQFSKSGTKGYKI